MRKMIAMAAAAITLGGCGNADHDALRQETLRTMGIEMPDEEKVSVCDSYDFDPDITYYAFAARWESIFFIDPPNDGEFKTWLQEDVCAAV